MKKFILMLLVMLIFISGCSSTELVLGEECEIGDIYYRPPSGWKFVSEEGSNYHYPFSGGMLFVSFNNLDYISTDYDEAQSNLKNTYQGFVSSAYEYSPISETFDAKENHSFSASFTADFGYGEEFTNYYSVIIDDSLYVFALVGTAYPKDKQARILEDVVSTIRKEE